MMIIDKKTRESTMPNKPKKEKENIQIGKTKKMNKK